MSARLSALVVTDAAAPARPLADALRAQTAAAELEVVVAAPREVHEDCATLLGDGFASVVFLDVDVRRERLAGSRLAGIRAAGAPLVVFTETHCFPEPGWAAGLLAAHGDGADAVGPVFRNGNPATYSSAAGFLAHYGTFAEPPPPPPWPDLPGHNSCYRRDQLLAFGDELGGLLELEYVLHGRMAAQGRRLALEPRAVVRHVNVSRRRTALVEAYLAGRLFGAARGCGWGAGRRLAYALAWPLVTVLRTRRHAGDARRIGVARTPGLLAALALRLACTSAGEAVGLLAGPGRAMEPMLEMELRRDRYLRGAEPDERRLLEAIASA